MNNIPKDIAIGMMVHVFFKTIVMSILYKDGVDLNSDTLEPRKVKESLVKHIDNVSELFHRELFYAMMRLNFSEENAEESLCGFVADYAKDNGKTPDAAVLFRFACGGDDVFNHAIDEYRRNFFLLLDGIVESTAEAVDSCGRNSSLGHVKEQLLESILSRLQEFEV